MATIARLNPTKFYIGIDANVKPLEKLSMKATRKLSKGGLPNAMFVCAAAEDLPEELTSVASQIHINFPWGSLLRAVAVGEREFLSSLRRIASDECALDIVIGIDTDKDRSELERLGVPNVTIDYIREILLGAYESAGFNAVDYRELQRDEWSRLETSWARRLSSNDSRRVFRLRFEV